MGLFYRFQDMRRLMKIANFCTLVFYSPLKVLPSELYNADTAQKSEMMDVLGGEKSLTIWSTV